MADRPAFGRLPAPDARDRAYPLRALIPPKLPASRLWRCPNAYLLDQGATSSCVGHGWAHFLAAAPRCRAVSASVAMELYRLAQTMDEWPGEDYDGTSVRGGAKACVSQRLIGGEYRWGFTEADVRGFLLGTGPVVIGVSWLTGMLDTDAQGFLNLTGVEEGGHCVTLLGYSAAREAYRAANSWGREWGQDGRCWIRRADFRALLEDMQGEACSAVEVAA